MSHLANTYQHIAAILSFESSNSELALTLSDPAFDWDAIVVEGSKHLVLPAIYCRLSQKQLLHVLPDELNQYLNEITTINRNRNERILEQVGAITHLFNTHDIEHVFLKGSALLAMGCYDDIAERMVGDIDILVNKRHIEDAFSLLQSHGYTKSVGFAYDKKDFRHLDRLISDDELAAVELHSSLLNKPYSAYLDPDLVLNSKYISNQIPVSCATHTALNLILGWQIHDHGHYYHTVNFKILADTLALKAHEDTTLITQLLSLKQGQSFLLLARNYFSEFKTVPQRLLNKTHLYFHKAMLNHAVLRKIISGLKYLILFCTERIVLIFSNKNYSKHVLKKIFYSKN